MVAGLKTCSDRREAMDEMERKVRPGPERLKGQWNNAVDRAASVISMSF